MQVDTDLARFKRRVRQLEELGLTEPLEEGYQLSPRGEDVAGHALATHSAAVE